MNLYQIQSLKDEELARLTKMAREVMAHRRAFRASIVPGVTVLAEGMQVRVVTVNRKRAEAVVRYDDGSEGIRSFKKLAPVLDTVNGAA